MASPKDVTAARLPLTGMVCRILDNTATAAETLTHRQCIPVSPIWLSLGTLVAIP